MQTLNDRFESLQRPSLLVSAARAGLHGYRRETHLARALGRVGHARLIRPKDAFAQLLDIESEINAQRRAEDANYCYARHVEVLIALLSEAALLRSVLAPVAAE